ncbi:MAG: winged helix-turn-helix domain-containing protein [Nitrososphaerota archaeon]|jgi:hypothetical protein|nr:winged helix-turn-helix domain-containing protein [Nitrososphaerota archaeon]
MSSKIESLNKILKDETRRKIILTLTDRESLSYTELMETLQIGSSTGTLNYHLKILGDLLEKTEAKQYRLSEKGKLASRFLTEFPEPESTLKTKKVWWRRFWIVAVLFPTLLLLIFLYFYFSGYLDTYQAVRAVFGFISSVTFVYFFYRMIGPKTKEQNQKDQNRTIQEVFVSGRPPEEVKEAIHSWIREENIKIEVEREGFIKGRIGIPSGLGLTAPKYFEVSFKPDQNGVRVHTEGWISIYDISERSFSNKILVSGCIPRRKGWKIMEHLWQNLRALSK